MSSKILNRLRSEIHNLSRTERKIAEVILRDPKRFITLSLCELSEIAEVSQGSIINFSNKFSSGGFPTLKLSISAAISDDAKQEPLFSAAVGSKGVGDVLAKTANSISLAMKNSVVMNSEEELKSSAEMILSAKKIEIFGLYRSAIVANNLYFQFLMLGMPASYVDDVLTNVVSASMLDSEGLVIAISNSGKTKDIIESVKIAKERGAKIISITSNAASPLAKLSDKVLLASASGNTISGRATEVQVSQILIADAICTYLQSRIDKGREDRYWALNDIFSAHNAD